jgi:hypothetical protein
MESEHIVIAGRLEPRRASLFYVYACRTTGIADDIRLFCTKWLNYFTCVLLNIYYSFMHFHSFILLSASGQAPNLFQSEFSTECDLVLHVSVSSVISFP